MLKWCSCAFDHEGGRSFLKELVAPRRSLKPRWSDGEKKLSAPKSFGWPSSDLTCADATNNAFQHRDLALISSPPRCSRHMLLDTCSTLLTVHSAYLLVSISTLLWTWHRLRTTAGQTRLRALQREPGSHALSLPTRSVQLHLFNLDLCCSRIAVYSPLVREAAARMRS